MSRTLQGLFGRHFEIPTPAQLPLEGQLVTGRHGAGCHRCDWHHRGFSSPSRIIESASQKSPVGWVAQPMVQVIASTLLPKVKGEAEIRSRKRSPKFHTSPSSEAAAPPGIPRRRSGRGNHSSERMSACGPRFPQCRVSGLMPDESIHVFELIQIRHHDPNWPVFAAARRQLTGLFP